VLDPSSARDALAYAAGALTPARKVDELLGAYRAEVLREAAAAIEEDGLHDAADRLRRLAASA
jgi:hypothetical protein